MSQHKHKRIFIIGHIGAGKALVAKTLASKLGWQFIDADLGLESRVGRPLEEILGKQGMMSLCQCQSNILASQLTNEKIVIATDPSLFADNRNMKLLESEFLVYLKVSTPTQVKRKSRDLSTLLPVNDYQIFLNKLHAERDSVYENAASFIINTDDNALEEHVLSIIKMISDNEKLNLTVNSLALKNKDLIMFHKKLHIPVHLSDQQARCLKLLAQGKSSKEIANDMNISFRTVEDHLANTMVDLGCSSSKELIAWYHDQPG